MRGIPFGNQGMQFEGDERKNGIHWCKETAHTIEPYITSPVFTDKPSAFTEIPRRQAIIHEASGTVTGITSNRCKIFQPVQAADFISCLAGNKYDVVNSGASRDYTKQWDVIQLEPKDILGDEVDQYLVVMNSFDGGGSFKVALTPVRVICNNMFSIALKRAKRIWSIRHTGDLRWKMDEARRSLKLEEEYMLELNDFAHSMTQVRIDDKALKAILNQCFKAGPKATEREIRTIEDKKDQFMVCYFMPDIDKFRGTGWGVINAMADYVSHAEPARHTASFDERRWLSLVDGDSLMNKVVTAVREV